MGNLPNIQRIYTDGACSGNPGPGGWGVVIYFSDRSRHELGGADAQTTNNRMEMQAAIAALEFLAKSGQPDPVELYTDSEYLKNGVTQWVHGWKKKGWKTSAGKPVLNQDLWQRLDDLNTTNVQWRYVRGHAGDEGNERCDAIARSFSLGKTPQLLQREDVEKGKQGLRRQASDESVEPHSVERDAEKVAEEFPVSPRSPVPVSPPPSQEQTSNKNPEAGTVQSNLVASESFTSGIPMTEVHPPSLTDSLDGVPREVKVAHLRDMVETLHVADEIAEKGYLITSSELADLMDVNASAVTSRGDHWVWRNWVVSRVRREGNQILWQLERVD